MRTDVRFRIRVLGACFAVLTAVIIARLYLVQVVHGDAYRADAMGQYVAPDPDTDSRGAIYFTSRDGTLVPAAVTQRGWRIAIVPKDIDNAQATYGALSRIVSLDKERFFASAAKANDPYEEVAFRIDDADAAQVRALKLPGVLLVQDAWRFYPGKSLAAQVLGFIGYKGDTRTGLYGLERGWQDTLAIDQDNRAVNPFAEIFANVSAALSLDPSAHQGDIITTIEPTVQQTLEDELDGVMKTYTPKLAGGIIMDPKTGDILAMGTRPAFDPNTYNLEKNPAVYSNPLVEGRYEMGSIMKPLTMADGIDTGAVTPTTTYDDTGCITRSGKKVCNYDFKARGVVPMQEILSQSLNVGATFVAEKIGHTNFAHYVQELGMGERTGIDLPNEVTGDIRALSGNSDVDFASASFGQGFAVSPLEMIRALSILADKGAMPKPHVVRAIRYESGVVRALSTSDKIQVVKPESAEAVTTMLVKVFDDALLHGELKQEHYAIAAKTGTAQIGIPGGGGYYADRYLHSFFGYFPAYDPKFIVFLFAVEPHGVEYASASLAHPFGDIEQFLIHYYDVAPDR